MARAAVQSEDEVAAGQAVQAVEADHEVGVAIQDADAICIAGPNICGIASASNP